MRDCEEGSSVEDTLPMKCKLCRINGVMGFLVEISSVTMTLLFSSILKRLVTNPSNPKFFARIYLVATLLVSAAACVIVYFTLGFGISVSCFIFGLNYVCV